MLSLNPFLRAFFKSSLTDQCNPVNDHVLLVPTTECLLTGQDRESGALYREATFSEEFLASHVLRIPNHERSGEGSVRDSRGKARSFNTINGRTVVVKESLVYSNKGFRNLNSAQLLTDQVFYSDGLESQQWLIYYISRPLVGFYESIKITPATLSNLSRSVGVATDHNGASSSSSAEVKREVRKFGDVLSKFPIIGRQMNSRLDEIFDKFGQDMNDWIPTPKSRRPSAEPRQFDNDSTTLHSNGSIHSTMSNRSSKSWKYHDSLYANEEGEHMRIALEAAVTSAIELFKKVDKQQLSFLGTTTELTGATAERMLERHVAENLHDSFLFPRLCNSTKMEDVELEAKISSMQCIDIAQVGIAIEDGRAGKDRLVRNVTRASDEFKKMAVAGSPQQMLEVLLSTNQAVTGSSTSDTKSASQEAENKSEKDASQIMNADTLVSMLLMVVIRSQVRHLHARLTYMRNFVFLQDVESGESGYALSTLEAVLSYLMMESSSLKTASQRNRRLWQATKTGNIDMIKAMLQSREVADEYISHSPVEQKMSSQDKDLDRNSQEHTSPETKQQSVLGPVNHDSEEITHSHSGRKQGKRVSMDIRSLSGTSEYSFLSRSTTLDSISTNIDADTSIETLAQTQDVDGNSILMMAVNHGQLNVLAYLVSLQDLFGLQFILGDTNGGEETLLSAATQLNASAMIKLLLQTVLHQSNTDQISAYLTRSDIRGRTIGHYLFHAPWLILEIGEMLPWTNKDNFGQTPLLALCRSYDHPNYAEMIHTAIQYATKQQQDEQPLHLDDHVDLKGNTLLHVVNHPGLAGEMLHCDSDPNATNDKQFTPLMVASKYGRMDMVRILFGDPRVDILAREARGMSAVELAKDDEVRSQIDDMVLVTNVAAADGRVTTVARSFFVEDASVRMIIKSATNSSDGMVSVTTCRRSLSDFENLVQWLTMEHPASWLPSIFNFRSPFQIPSRPSRAALLDIQIRLDKFLKIMIAHPTFSKHELLWEFILFPEIQPAMLAERSRKKAELRTETIREEFEPVEDPREVSMFVEHARESLRGINHCTKSACRKVNNSYHVQSDLSIAASLCAKDFSTLVFLPLAHVAALTKYAATLQTSASEPHRLLHGALFAILSTILAILSALARPNSLIARLRDLRKSLDRQDGSLRRSDRWLNAPLGLLEEARRGNQADIQAKMERTQIDIQTTACELRYTQQTVASELAEWQGLHARDGRRAIREYARGMVIREKMKLEGMRRALRSIQRSQTGKTQHSTS